MRIIGIGVDIVEIKRIKKIVRKNKSFLKRMFTSEEITYCFRKKKGVWEHLAVRFAAKEAVWKALGKNNLSLKSIGIVNSPTGKPIVTLQGKKEKNIYLSLSHCDNYALAQAILVE